MAGKESGKMPKDDLGKRQKAGQERLADRQGAGAGKKPEETRAENPGGKQEKAPKEAKKKKASDIPFGRGAKLFLGRHYLVLSAVLFLAIIIGAWFVISMPGQGSIEDFWKNSDTPAANGQLRMIIITSKKCPGCEVNNSLEKLFSANGINYAVNNIEGESDDGKGLIAVTGIKKLPGYIIEEESITDKMMVSTKSGFSPLKDVLQFYVNSGKGTHKEGFFVFPEMELDGILRPRILLGGACGTKNNIYVQWFADPYDPNTIARSKDYETLRQLLESERPFDVNSVFDYGYLPTYSVILEKDYLATFGGKQETIRRNIRMPARYLMCASDVFGTETFKELERAMYSIYCEIDENTMAGTEVRPLFNCSDSNHYNIILSADEMVDAAEKAGIKDNMVFNACLLDSEKKFAEMEAVAKAADIDRTPKLLINCEYEVPMINAYNALCNLNYDLGFCPAMVG